MKDLWDEIDLLVPGPGCDCEETRPFIDQFKNLRLLQFLVGLNESYSQGHLKENCYKIIGYPTDFKSKKKQQGQGNRTYANMVTEEITSSSQGQQMGQLFTKGQNKQILELLNKTPAGIIKYKFQQGLYNGKVMGIDRENCGLYILKWRDKQVTALVTKNTDECSLWHMRLGHPSIVAIKHIPALKNKLVDSIQHNCESKCEVVTVLKDFLIMVKSQFDMNVKVLRSDNGREFFNSSFNELLASLGIVHQSSCPYTPQQNGVVERKNRYILEVARALQFQSSVPNRFWGDSIKTTVFGCMCFSSNLPKGDKFAKRARKLVLIGYSEVQKGYRLFDLETKAIFVSRDVSFREHIFPFKESVTTPQDPFPTQASIPPHPDPSLPISTDTHIPPTYNAPAIENTNTPTT
ncbi:uncharacterized protein LOC142182149 [Nicotiana tabacum]|uniref:Uncharacterized protein LOC142182149 n=1 Tax=Nicotiana tabacum TaxID=4097 RepID=A0AC58URW5_TOBAC